MSNDEGMTKTRMTKKLSILVRHLGIAGSFVIRHSSFVISFAVLAALVCAAPPSAKDILESVRMLESRQQIDLDGQLREDEKVIPFHLTQTGPLIRYSFTDPDEVLQLRLGENGSRLELATDDKTEKIPTEKLKEKVRGTGITYEDLTLEFLYWENTRVLGDETIRTRSCWKLQVVAASKDSQYWNVVIWVDKVSGALMRMDGYDWDGKVAKRFEVVSAQKIDNRWFLKQMRVEEMKPGTNKVESRTYLEIKK
jgi:hypothetical protein